MEAAGDNAAPGAAACAGDEAESGGAASEVEEGGAAAEAISVKEERAAEAAGENAASGAAASIAASTALRRCRVEAQGFPPFKCYKALIKENKHTNQTHNITNKSD